MTLSNNKQDAMGQRKDDHLRYALAQKESRRASEFDKIRFIHTSFSPINTRDISLETTWATTTHALPFFINAMTGGSRASKIYNEMLSIVARELSVPIATGSVSAAISNCACVDSYQIVRDVNPSGFVMANLGAHHDVDNAQRAVDLLRADALQIHLNTPQELVMPEGDRDFTTWVSNIERIVRSLQVPVIVKECGFGMNRITIELLKSIGVQTIDVSGRGGTNFITIENERRTAIEYSLIENWGQTTPESLIESYDFKDHVELIASGGVQSPLDIVKALALGAKGVGISGEILHLVHQQGVDKTIEILTEWREMLVHLFALLNAQRVEALLNSDILLTGDLREYALDRNMAIQHLANRQVDVRGIVR